MPSPIAHASMVLVVHTLVDRHHGLRQILSSGHLFFYTAAIVALWAPDVDFLLRTVFEYPALRHGGATHSLTIGVLFGFCFALACRVRYGAALPMMPVLGTGIGCAWAHAVMDIVTWGGGVMLLWPFSAERYAAIPLFYGARHSQPAAWHLHLITLTTELLFVGVLWWLARRFWWRRSAPATELT